VPGESGTGPEKGGRTGQRDRDPDRPLAAALARLALSEDIGTGDVTTLATIEPSARATARVVARASGVFSGLLAAGEVASAVDPSVELEELKKDGERLSPGDLVLRLSGPARSLLTMERVLLNFLQHLSGIATLTARFVEAVAGTGVAVTDTRKTTPGLRFLEKAAVVHGGGVNHRMGLWDAYMIKDNHIAAAGGITEAVRRVRRRARRLPLTVEARSLAEVEEAARLGVDQILLDNMDPAQIAAAVSLIRRVERDLPPESGVAVRIEVSGGISLQTIRDKALAGVNLISVGALTHSVPALDLAMDLELLPSRHPDRPAEVTSREADPSMASDPAPDPEP
jgi:nicotinate-nucleotide pyrophosphorylase (carboxylating)